MTSKGALRRLAAVAVIGLIAATGCSTSKTATQQPPASSPATPVTSTPTVGQSVDLSGMDTSLNQIDEQMSGANAGLNSTSEGDVQTQ